MKLDSICDNFLEERVMVSGNIEVEMPKGVLKADLMKCGHGGMACLPTEIHRLLIKISEKPPDLSSVLNSTYNPTLK